MEPFATLSDASGLTVVPVNLNTIEVNSPFTGLDSEAGCYSTDFSTVMLTLGHSKSPLFLCFKFVLQHILVRRPGPFGHPQVKSQLIPPPAGTQGPESLRVSVDPQARPSINLSSVPGDIMVIASGV